MIKGTFKLTGLDEYLERVQQAGNDIVAVAAEAVEESVKPVHAEIKAWAQKHKDTGAVLGGVIEPIAKIEGNYITAEAGISGTGGSWEAVFVEYGKPGQSADPGIRPAFEKAKTNVPKIQKEVLKKRGVPIV